MLSSYQLKIADFYNIPIANVKKIVPNFFDKKVCGSLWKLATLFEARIKTKEIHCALEFNWSQWLKSYVEFNKQKIIEVEKMKKTWEI